jgi:dipeptidyl aminopeptidase/acylaminoacyl peptidase
VIESVTYSASHTAALVATDTDTPQIFAVEGKELRKLTFNNSDLLEQVRLGKTEDISFKSKDGTEVHALLTTPPDYVAGKRYFRLVQELSGD